MKKTIYILFLNTICLIGHSQIKDSLTPKVSKSVYINLSIGSVVFGTGDFFGNSIMLDFSKNVVNKPRWGLSKLCLGGEIIFENGVKNPVIQNPTLEEFWRTTFYHRSSTILWAKASYYPFKKYIGGFNIQLGPTFGYTNRSREERATRVEYGGGYTVRQSTLLFNNSFNFGYRISTGFDINLSRSLLMGFRVDFSNNSLGEINTLIGGKVGVNL